MPYKPSQFQSTIIKPYYEDNSSEPLQNVLKDILKDISENILKDILEDVLEDVLEENYNQHALEGDYDFNIIIVDIPQL